MTGVYSTGTFLIALPLVSSSCSREGEGGGGGVTACSNCSGTLGRDSGKGYGSLHTHTVKLSLFRTHEQNKGKL